MYMFDMERVSDAAGSADALLDAQREVLESIVRGRSLREVLAQLCSIVEAQAPEFVRAAILLVDESGTRLTTGAAPSLPDEYSRAIDGAPIDPDLGTCCAAAARGRVVVTRSIASDPAWAQLRHLPLGIGLVAAWSMPILTANGRVLGTFGTYFREEREPTARERQLIEVMARTAALAIEREHADRALRADSAQQGFLAELAAATQPLTDPAEIMQVTARLLASHLRVDRCAYAEVEDERVFVITGDHTVAVPSIVGRWRVEAFGSAFTRHMLEGRAFVVDDVDAHPDIGLQDRPAYEATNIRAVICAPLHKNGRFTAGMAVHQRTPRGWSASEVELVSLVAARCWEALERARIARDLAQSEARYRAIVEASPECVKLVGRDGALLQMNAAGLRMIEAEDGAAALGACVYDVIAPEYRETFQAFNERVCDGQSGTLEFEIVGLKGTRRSMETTAVALPSPTHGFVQLAVTRDVGQRVAAEKALADNRARLDYAVRLSGVGFWYCDLPFDELKWDERVKEHFFLPPDARVTIDTFYECIHPEDREPTRQAIQTSIDNHTSYDVVYRTFEPRTRAVKFIRALGGAAYAADGSPVRFDGVTVDVTQHKLDQARLAALLEREQTQGRLLAKVAEAALVIHTSGSTDGALQAIAEQARDIIGAQEASAHLSGNGSFTTATDSASSRIATLTAAQPQLIAHVQRSNRPLRLSRADGTREGVAHHEGWIAAPFVGPNGANIGWVQLAGAVEGEFDETHEAVLVQLAQIAAVGLENARLYEQLREQDRRKDEFLATLAHELRNPLAPVRTGLEVLRLTSDPERADKVREMMDRQLRHLVRMVDDLLDISRITLGKLALKKERIDFRTVLHSALETVRPTMDSSAHELAVRLPKDPLPLEVDATRLAQIIANLLNNAAKYTPAGGRIQLAAEREGAQLAIRVSDTGVGIPADMLESIFDMFTQVSRSLDRSQGGLGVGLTLVRRLVQLHGGSIVAESAGPGQGSVFTVRLPLAAPESQPGDAAHADRESHAQPLRALIVDDNVDAAESLAMLLELSGHATRVAYTGRDSLTAATEFSPDIVLLDIGLPDLDGYEIARRLRSAPASESCFLAALTGWGSEDDQRRAHTAGFDRHVVKPIDMGKLEDVLRAAQAARRLHAAPARV